MSDWRMQGSSQRRRMGAPSNHLESVEAAMPKTNITDPAAALAGMAKIGNPRVPMGNAAYTFNDASSAPSKNTKQMPKAHSKDGSLLGPAGNKVHQPYPLPAGKGDRNGAAYRVTVATPVLQDPVSGPTMANSRIVMSAVNRSLPNFQGGIEGV